MRTFTPMALCLMAAATPILSAPAEATSSINLKECTKPAACQPPYLAPYTLFVKAIRSAKHGFSGANLPPSPHFPPHQLSQPGITASAQRPMLHIPQMTRVELQMPPVEREKPTKSREDQSSSLPQSLPAAPTSALPDLRAEDAQRFGFIAVAERVESAALRAKVKCHRNRLTTLFKHKVEDAGEGTTGEAYTYTYGYTYVRKDYADILVVGIVLVFLIAVVLVEMMDSIIQTARQILGLPGAIRLEDDEALSACAESDETRRDVKLCTCGGMDEKL